MDRKNCLKCGADLGARFRWARMVNCDHCGTAHILRDAVFEQAGSAGLLHEAPGLITLHQPLATRHGIFTPEGVVRFSYGRGTWDEFWATCPSGPHKGAWISVDEGDLALQWPIEAADLPQSAPVLGVMIHHDDRDWMVNEAETARCLGFRGQLPEAFAVDQLFTFVNASCGDGRILSGEFGPEGASWFCGPWLDPFDLPAAP